jgi:hypothetical protein
VSALLGLWIAVLSFLPLAYADDARDRVVDDMKGRQQGIFNSVSELIARVNNIDANDPRKNPPKDKDGKPICEGAVELRKKAEGARDVFINLTASSHVIKVNGVYVSDAAFDAAEKKAIEAMNDVNRFLAAPVQPGAKSLCFEGTVPKGNLFEDFIPQLIRLMFRFTSVMILISFIVSGVLFIIAFDNEDYTSKAKRMLYYSIVGFGFVTLAYAIVKGITQVNYFGIV